MEGLNMKRLKHLIWLVLLFSVGHRAYSQASATASRLGTFQVGAGVTAAAPDYGTVYVKGVSAYADFDFREHLGVELAAHQASIITPTDIGEDSYLIGPRYFRTYGRLIPYAKLMIGIGRFDLQYDYAPHSATSYLVYALGGGLDIRATQHINIRAIDFEAQRWPGYAANGLTPYVTTVGAAYNFH